MHFDASAGQSTASPARPATDRGDDTDTHSNTMRRKGVTPGTRLAREDHQPEPDGLETELLESEQLFRTMFERSVVGLAHVGLDGSLLRFNQRFCDILGYSRKELATRTFQDVTHPDDLADDLTSVRRVLTGELEGYEMDKRYRRRDGTPVWAHLTVTLVHTPEGAPDYFISMVQDITERKRLEQECTERAEQERAARSEVEAALSRAIASEAQVTERAERLNTILETMADGVAVYDAEGRPLQLTNRVYRELLAVEHAPGYESLTTFERARLLDLRDATTNAPLAFAETPVGRALRGEVVTGLSADIRARAFDGRELELNSSAAPLRDADGRIAGVVLVLRDMTWRKHLEREREAVRIQAERQADQLDRIFEAAADGLLVYDADGRVMRENPAARRILGLDAASPDFQHLPLPERLALYALRDEHDRPVPYEQWPTVRAMRGEGGVGKGGAGDGARAGTEPEEHDVRLRALDGREREVASSAAPLRDREGHLVGAVFVLHDRTERNRLAREREAARADELAAQEANRRMEQFLATAAHDLRLPLTATIGYLDLVERQAERLAAIATTAQGASPDLTRQVATMHTRLQEASQGAERLARLLTLLFDTAALHADRLEVHQTPGDLVALVREQVEALRVAAPDRTIRLHAPASGESIMVEADAARIGQVVTNYVTNALKYSPQDQPVDVSAEVHGKRARVTVCDRGPGIPKGEQARVWELFHRVPGVTVHGGTQSGSLGLGLHISKAIIEAHGGRVGVKSTAGQGSTFWFSLSRAPRRHLARQAPRPEASWSA